MEQVWLDLATNPCQLGRQSQGVRWVLEERISLDLDFVKTDSWVGLSPANGPTMADDVDFVTAVGKGSTKLRRDDSAAPDRRVADEDNL